MNKRTCSLISAGLPVSAILAHSAEPIDIGDRRELFLDEGIYDKSHRWLGDVPPNEVLTWLDSRNYFSAR